MRVIETGANRPRRWLAKKVDLRRFGGRNHSSEDLLPVGSNLEKVAAALPGRYIPRGLDEEAEMKAGRPFQSYAPELKTKRLATESLIQMLNSTDPFEIKKRQELLRRILGSVGRDADIRLPFYAEYGDNINIGDDVFFGQGCVFGDAGRIDIGNRAIIGTGVKIGTTVHSSDPKERQEFDYARPVVVKADAILSGGTTIAPGVTIGRDSKVLPNSYVRESIPDGVLAGGNPCRVIRKIVDTSQASRYLSGGVEVDPHVISDRNIRSMDDTRHIITQLTDLRMQISLGDSTFPFAYTIISEDKGETWNYAQIVGYSRSPDLQFAFQDGSTGFMLYKEVIVDHGGIYQAHKPSQFEMRGSFHLVPHWFEDATHLLRTVPPDKVRGLTFAPGARKDISLEA